MKAIPSENYIVQPFVTHKSQIYSYVYGGSDNPAEIAVMHAKRAEVAAPWEWTASDTQDATGIYEQNLFESVKNLFSSFLSTQYASTTQLSASLVNGKTVQYIDFAANQNAAEEFFFEQFFPVAYFGTYFEAQPVVDFTAIYTKDVHFFKEVYFPLQYFAQVGGFSTPSGSQYNEAGYFSPSYFPTQVDLTHIVGSFLPISADIHVPMGQPAQYFENDYFSTAYFPTEFETTGIAGDFTPFIVGQPPQYFENDYFSATYFPTEFVPLGTETKIIPTSPIPADKYFSQYYFSNNYFYFSPTAFSTETESTGPKGKIPSASVTPTDAYFEKDYFANNYFYGLSAKNIFDIVKNLSGIYVISCAQKSFGEAIRRGSVRIHSPISSYDLVDDGAGNIILEGTTVVIGNILYSLGIIVLMESVGYGKSTIFNKVGASITEGQEIDISYDATVTIYEHQVICTIDQGEFNFPTNPTLAKASQDGSIPINAHASGDMPAYITTVGIYSDRGELLAIAKFPQPIRRAVNSSQSFIIRWDA